MHKLSRESWIRAGFKTLDSLGYIHLSAEKIARQLNVTRGSFYHHFRSRSDFVDALMDRWREDYTDQVIAYARVGLSAQERLERYLEISAPLHPGREVAIRAWAAKDRRVLAVLERVDASRIRFTQEMGRELLPLASDSDINRLARLAYLALIGFQQTGPHGSDRFVQLVQDILAFCGVRHELRAPAPSASAPPGSCEWLSGSQATTLAKGTDRSSPR